MKPPKPQLSRQRSQRNGCLRATCPMRCVNRLVLELRLPQGCAAQQIQQAPAFCRVLRCAASVGHRVITSDPVVKFQELGVVLPLHSGSRCVMDGTDDDAAGWNGKCWKIHTRSGKRCSGSPLLGRATARSPGLPVKFPGPTPTDVPSRAASSRIMMNLTAGEHEPCNGTSLGQMVITLIFPSSSSEMALVVWRRLIDTVHGVAKVANCAQLR